MDTTILKSIHVTCVALSYSLFFLRGVWMLRDSPALQQRWVKIAPHTVDSVLLASAIALAWQLGISPLTHPWLAAKIVALLLYIAHWHIRTEARKDEAHPPRCLADGSSGIFVYRERGRDTQPDALANSIGNRK